MYDALGHVEGTAPEQTGTVKDGNGISRHGLYEVPDDVYDQKLAASDRNSIDSSTTGNIYEKPPGSAVISPSAVVHKSSPQVQIRQIALNPTTVDTDKDTQQLVEEDKSEC